MVDFRLFKRPEFRHGDIHDVMLGSGAVRHHRAASDHGAELDGLHGHAQWASCCSRVDCVLLALLPFVGWCWAASSPRWVVVFGFLLIALGLVQLSHLSLNVEPANASARLDCI